MTTWAFSGAGASFTQRIITSDGNIAEDRIASSTGSYAAQATLSGSSQTWILQVVAFKAAPAGSCMATTCAAQGKDCGTIFDGCGGTLTCNSCSAPASCGGSGVPNVCGSASVRKYATDFNIAETPLTEGGLWKQLGLDWSLVTSTGGLVFGTQNGSGAFNDSYAYLSGAWPANQSGSGVIHLESGITATYAEVEVLLRWTDGPHDSTGYECNLAYNGQYAEIIKWPGPFATDTSQFTFISKGNPVASGVHDGDVFSCEVVGNVITSRLNGNVIATGTDNSIATGAPGIGFYASGAPASQKFSFTKFTATGL
jgi:hypothetical protein